MLVAQKRANQPPASTIGATAPRRFADLHQMSSSAVLLLTPSPSTATFAAQRSASERAASRVAWQSLQPRCKCDRVGARRASFAATSPRNFAEFDANAQRGSEKRRKRRKKKESKQMQPKPRRRARASCITCCVASGEAAVQMRSNWRQMRIFRVSVTW